MGDLTSHDRLVTVATFWNSVDANIARLRLNDAGIRSFLADDMTVSLVWYYGNAIGGIKLQVAERDADAALDALSDDSQDEVADPSESHPSEDQANERLIPPEEIDDEDHVTRGPQTAREENADRALRGAIIGLLFIPLQIYVFWLLLKVFVSEEELRPEKRRRAIWAAAINIPLMFLIGLYLRSL